MTSEINQRGNADGNSLATHDMRAASSACKSKWLEAKHRAQIAMYAKVCRSEGSYREEFELPANGQGNKEHQRLQI